MLYWNYPCDDPSDATFVIVIRQIIDVLCSKEQASRQESSRRQSGAVNGGVTPSAEATNAFNLQQLQAAYSQAAINSNAAMLKDASKAKTPPDNYSYYSSATQPATTTGEIVLIFLSWMCF